MKILRLDLRAFGPFTNIALDLSGGREGLHLIYGPNEAGKSSALRAVKQMLYGIPSQSDDKFIHPYDSLRIGATLRHVDGTEVSFLRRKGNKRTLLKADGENGLEDTALEPYLGAVGPEQFSTLFGIDQKALAQGGKVALDTGGHIGQLLFGAGLDLARFRHFQKRLEDQLAQLFKPSGSVPELNKVIAEFNAAKKKIDEESIHGADWTEHTAALDTARLRKNEIERALEDACREKARLERFKQAAEDLASRRRLLEDLDSLAGVMVLREDFGEERRRTQQMRQQARETESETVRKAEALRAELGKLDVPDAVLGHAELIDAAYRDLRGYQKALPEVVKLRAEYEQFSGRLRTEAEALRLPGDRPEANYPRITPFEQKRIDSLIADGIKARERHAAAVGDLASKTQADRLAREELAGRATERDPGRLRLILQRLTREGDLETQKAIALADVRKLEDQLIVDLRKLGLWTGTLEQLETLALPSLETIDRFERELDTLAGAVDQKRTRLEDAEKQLQAIQHQIEQARLEQDVPTEDDLMSARQWRTQGWRTVKARWQGGAVDEAGEHAFLRGASDLAEAFELSVQNADDVADRLRREAQRVAAMARLRVDAKAVAGSLEPARAALEAAWSQHEEARTQWLAVWSAIGITTLTPREMRAWSMTQAQLVTKARELRDLRDHVVTLDVKLNAARTELNDALLSLGEASADSGDSLNAIRSRAELVLEQIQESNIERRELERRCKIAHEDLESAKRQTAAAKETLAVWQSDWAEAIAPLGLGPTARDDEARAVLESLRTIADLAEKCETRRTRIGLLENESDRFQESVGMLVTRVAPELAGQPADYAASQLNARLSAAREARTKRDQIETRLEELRDTAGDARTRVEAAERTLIALCREASCEREVDLPVLEERSSLRRSRERELNEAESRLRKLAGGLSLDAFVADAEVADVDVLPLQIAQLEEQVSRLSREKENVDQSIGREEEAIRRMGALATEARALDAAAQKQDLRARIESGVDRFIRLKLASTVLREAMERYREKNQGPVLSRAAAIFADLTCGSFEGLRTDLNDRDEPVLVGIRAGTRAQIGVEGMSDGTNDQLFLALKLALLEHYLERNPPLPFIVDDVLIQFDDARSVAALRALGDLSMRTQVLFFTHHEHLVDLARAHLPADVLIVHQLPGRRDVTPPVRAKAGAPA